MNTKGKKGIIGITLAAIMIASIFAVINPATVVASGGVTVDGYVSPGTEWDNAIITIDDPQDISTTWDSGYDIKQVKTLIEENTLYFLMDVYGTPADTDGDGDPNDNDGSVNPGMPDNPGVGGGVAAGAEEYYIDIDADGDCDFDENDYRLRYTQDDSKLLNYLTGAEIAGAVTDEAYGDIVELSLEDASDYINTANFCIQAWADTDWNGLGEDATSKECFTKPPEFDFEFTDACCRLMDFNGWTTNMDPAEIENHSWYFGAGADPDKIEDISGAPDGNPPPTVTYSTCGMKTVTLSGYSGGVKGEVTKTDVYVACDPTAVANANKTKVEAGAGEVVKFDCAGSHVDPSAPPKYGLELSYHWEFDDEETGSSDDECVTTRVVDGEDGDIICGTLTVNDTHCNDTDEVCVRVWAPTNCTLRVYGFLNRGAGDPGVVDDETGKHPENPPYAYDPEAAFYPQAGEAPRKDFITFDPIIMSHKDLDWDNDEVDDYVYRSHIKNDGEDASEKVFKRMWYEPTEWYKDEDKDSELDFVLIKGDQKVGWINETELHEWLKDGWIIKPYNSDDTLGDIYAPSIKQEFTYMMLDWSADAPQPLAAPTRTSTMLIPMASWESSKSIPVSPNGDNGIDSFDADGDGAPDHVRIESEASLGIDIDNDGGALETLDPNGIPLDGDETLVLTLDPRTMKPGDELQFFDHKIVLKDVFGGVAEFRVYYQGETSPPGELLYPGTNVVFGAGDVKFFKERAENTGEDVQGPFFVQVTIVDSGENKVLVKVGRMFGQTYANIGANPYWNQKQFYVDSVCYNVVAIMTDDEESLKYVTFRMKLPKVAVEIPNHSEDLKGWSANELLPEMPQYNMPHDIACDIQEVWTVPERINDKIGEKAGMPALEIVYLEETVEPRFHGELKEIYHEYDSEFTEEGWMIEWFQTIPFEYTLFRLPPPVIDPDTGVKGGNYLVTSAFWADESLNVLWDGGEPIGDPWFGKRLKFWYEDCTGPYFIDLDGTLRIYGYLDKGAGNYDVEDPETGYPPENPPYTMPDAPFYPQSDEAPEKDFVTFNPIIMSHKDLDWNNNDIPDIEEYGFYVYRQLIRNADEDASEKVFKRMWYEPVELYKDEYGSNGLGTPGLDVLLSDGREWVPITRFEDPEFVAELIYDGITIVPNSDDTKADIYAPSIKQEFTYMMLDWSADAPVPAAAPTGTSSMMIPMASWESGNGIDSFDADGRYGVPEGTPDRVLIESERSLEIDIDNDDGGMDYEPLDPTPWAPLSGDETLVLTTDEKTMKPGDELQFFDHKIVLTEYIYGDNATFSVYYQGETTPEDIGDFTFEEDQIRYFKERAENTGEDVQGPFFVQVIIVDSGEDTVRVKVGRMFGQTYANIGANDYWNQKQFYVDGVCYNVVAIMTDGEESLKYVTFRQKLPKEDVQIPNHSQDLEGWDANDVLPEMPQFNMDHTIVEDIQREWTKDKIGDALEAPALTIKYLVEDTEPRFHGELKEIYYEEDETESWMIEWFQTIPYQYTGFKLPNGHGLYMVTSAFYAPESCFHQWDGGECIGCPDGGRLKYWFDPQPAPGDNYVKDIYVNRPPKVALLNITQWYDLGTHGGNDNGKVDLPELRNAILDYIYAFGSGTYPFGPGGIFDIEDLRDMLRKFAMGGCGSGSGC